MTRKDELIEAIRAAVAREQPANLEEANAIFERLQAEHNHTPLEAFDGKFLLTVKGRKVHEKHGPADAYPALFETFASKFNWGYWDGYSSMSIVQEAFLFSLRLLSRHGDVPRPESFYSEAFLRAFPMLLEEDSREEVARSGYGLRTFLFAEFLGLAERMNGPDRRLLHDSEALVRKRPLLDAWIRFQG